MNKIKFSPFKPFSIQQFNVIINNQFSLISDRVLLKAARTRAKHAIVAFDHFNSMTCLTEA